MIYPIFHSLKINFQAATLASLCSAAVIAEEFTPQADFSGYVEAQARLFPSENYSGQRNEYFSVALNPRWRFELTSDITATVRLFARHDFSDDSRTHADIREAMLQIVRGNQDWRIGIGEVFWGVTESRHLVDIINQEDFLERFDGDAKLGQPLLNWDLHNDSNNFSVYVLPSFREREFPGPGGRLRGPLPTGPATYDSGADENHVDAAARWQWSGEGQDIALSYFKGTERDPVYRVAFEGNQLLIRPEYLQLSQWGLDAQKSIGNLMLKLEAVHRDTDNDTERTSWGSVAGFEYTFENIADGDLGAVVEYLRDTRKIEPRAITPQETFEDDIFVGARFSANSLSSTYFLGGVYQDRTHGGRIFKLEANTRIGQNMKLTLEAWRFDQLESNELIAFFSKDDFFEIGIQYFID